MCVCLDLVGVKLLQTRVKESFCFSSLEFITPFPNICISIRNYSFISKALSWLFSNLILHVWWCWAALMKIRNKFATISTVCSQAQSNSNLEQVLQFQSTHLIVHKGKNSQSYNCDKSIAGLNKFQKYKSIPILNWGFN